MPSMHTEFAAQIMDPAGQQTRLDDDDCRLVLSQKAAHFALRRLETREAKLAGGLVAGTGDALVFAQVDGQNGVRGRRFRDGAHGASSSWGWWGLFAW